MAAHRSTALFRHWFGSGSVFLMICGLRWSGLNVEQWLRRRVVIVSCLLCLFPLFYLVWLITFPISRSPLLLWAHPLQLRVIRERGCGGMWWVWLNGRSLYSLASPVASDRFLLWWGCEVPPLQINVWLFNWVTFNIQPFVCVSWLFIVTFFKCFSSFNKEFLAEARLFGSFCQSWSYDIFCKGTAVTWDFPSLAEALVLSVSM